MLFPERCNLFGDLANVKYLKKCLPDVEFIETDFENEPVFATDDEVHFIYMGSMTERMQEKTIQKLNQYKERIDELIKRQTVFLFTGNSFEIFGDYIEDDRKIPGLGLIDIYSKREMFNRYNDLFLGEMEGLKIVGFKSQFSHSYTNNEAIGFCKIIKGIGLNKESRIRRY